jgi:tRNA A-37 threonylcarbamoyl transferase component Bud32/tetratricopeptide (TPR) repeat protein
MALFDELVELPPAERQLRLAEVAASDGDLGGALVRLLAADAAEARGLLETPPGLHELPTEPLLPAEPMPERAGPYRLVGLLGRGGMADVYAGERADGDFAQRVAVKVLRRGLDTHDLLARFLRERRILARLEHPAIARLLDGGELADGRPYLAMERVDGLPMHRYAERHGLGVEQRLALLRTACEAVAFAHRNLVVHRDIKPSNVLVTERGEVKLLDFGIAKLIAAEEDHVARTASVQRLLTPAYAAPEQRAGGNITTATDVWGLGALAYELLVGEPPYEAEPTLSCDPLASPERPPPKPSTRVLALRGTTAEGRRWAARLAGDLDVIVLKALALDPGRRYASVQELADDLDRHLGGLPVRARPDSFAYRAGKLVRRHRIEAGAAALLVLTLAAATIVSVREAHLAREQERRAQAERARAERHFASVRGLASSFVFEVHDAIKDLPGSTAARDLVVSTALEYLDALAAEAGPDTRLELELAAAYERVADIQGEAYRASKGQPAAALESYGKAIALLETIVAADARNAAALGPLGRAYRQQSQLYLLLGDARNAARRSAQAITTLEGLTAMRPDAATRRSLAKAYKAHSYTIDMAGEKADAGFEYVAKALEILEALVRQSPDDLELIHELAGTYTMAGIAMERDDRLPGALDRQLGFYRQALAMDERLLAATRGENAAYARSVLVDRINLALTSYDAGDHRGAIRHAREGLSFLATRPVDPGDGQARVDVANLQWALGRALLAAGELEEAAAVFQEMTVELEAVAREGETLKVQFLLGAAAWGMGSVHLRLASRVGTEDAERLVQWRRAERWYGRALPYFERVSATVTLPAADRRFVEEATTGSARARAEIEKLQAGSPAG